MNQHELISTLFKVIGVYCGIVGFDVAAAVVGYAAVERFSGFAGPYRMMIAQTLARPAVYFVAFYLLIFKTDWCMKQLNIEKGATQ